jgi:hypothetical protein
MGYEGYEKVPLTFSSLGDMLPSQANFTVGSLGSLHGTGAALTRQMFKVSLTIGTSSELRVN